MLDAGDGRRLDRFGAYLVDRPSPAASGLRRALPGAWAAADLRWERGQHGNGTWSPTAVAVRPWIVEAGTFRLELRPTASGQVGCFPEHAAGWRWLAALTAAAVAAGRPMRVLNLFAYTGGATLAAAAAGAAVTHVDAQRGVVAWARRNAELSGLAAAPLRWIVDDAAEFAAREWRRGHGYEAVVLDPPTYGHGRPGRTWQIEEMLPALLGTCVALGGPEGPPALLLTCHSAGLGPAELEALLRAAWPAGADPAMVSGRLEVAMRDGRALEAGAYVRTGPR